MPTNYLRRNMDLACSFSGTTFTLTMDSSYPVRIGGQVIKTFVASDPYNINASFNILNAAGESIVSIPNSNVYDLAGNSLSSTTYNNKQFPFYTTYDEINVETGEIEVKTGTGMYSMDSGSSTTVSSIFKTGDEVICIIDIDNVRIYLCSETIFNHIMESCANIDNYLSTTFPSFYEYVIKYNDSIMDYIDYIMDFINNYDDDTSKLIMLDDKDHSDNSNISERVKETFDDAVEYQDSSQEKYTYMRINQEDNYILDNGDIIYGNLSVNELYSNNNNTSVAPISYVKCEFDESMHIVNTPYNWFSVYNSYSKNSTCDEYTKNISIGSVTSGSNQVVSLYSNNTKSNTSDEYDFAYAIAYFKLLYPDFVDGSTTLDKLPNLGNNAAFVVDNVLYTSLEFIQTPVTTSETLNTSSNPNVNDIYAVYDLSGIEMLRNHCNIYGYISDEFINRFCTEYGSSLYSVCLNSVNSSGIPIFSENLFESKNSSEDKEENYYWGIATTLAAADCSYSSSTNSIVSNYNYRYNGFYPIPKSTMYSNMVFKFDNRISIKVNNTVINIPFNLSCMSYKSSNTVIDLYYDMSDFAGSWWNSTFMNNALKSDNGFYINSEDSLVYIDMLFDTIDSENLACLYTAIPSYYYLQSTNSVTIYTHDYGVSSSQNEISVNFYNPSASVTKKVENINNIKYLTMPIAEFSLNYTNFLKTYGNFILNSTDISNSYTGALGSRYNDDDDRLYSMNCSFNYIKYVLTSRCSENNELGLYLNNNSGCFAMTTDNSILKSSTNAINAIVAKFGFRYPVINDTISSINTNISNILVTHYLYGVCNVAGVLSGTSINIDEDTTNTWLTIKNENQSCSYDIMSPYDDSKKITIDNFLRYMLNTDSLVLYCRRRNYDFTKYYKYVKDGRTNTSVGVITPLTIKLTRNDEYVTNARNREGALSSPLNDGLIVLYCSPIDLIYSYAERRDTKGIYHEMYRVNNDTNEEDDSISGVIQLGTGTGQYIAVWFDETGKMCSKSDGTMPTTTETGGIVVSTVVRADDTNEVKIVYDLVMNYSSDSEYSITSAKTYDANGNESSSGTYYKIYNGVIKINLYLLQTTPLPIGILDDANSFISITKNSVVKRRDKHIKSLTEIPKFSDAIMQSINSYGPAYDSSLYTDYVEELYKNIPCYNLFLNSYTSSIRSYDDAYTRCIRYITTSTANSNYLIHPKYILNTSGLNKIDLSSKGYPVLDSGTLKKNDFLSIYDFFNMAINHYINIDSDEDSSIKSDSSSKSMSIYDMTQLQKLIDTNQSEDIYSFTYIINPAENSSGYYNKSVIPVDADGNTYEDIQNTVRYNIAISGLNKTKSISLTDEQFNDLPLDGSLGIITTSELNWSDLLDALNNNKSISISQQTNIASETLRTSVSNNTTYIELIPINPDWTNGKTFGSE